MEFLVLLALLVAIFLSLTDGKKSNSHVILTIILIVYLILLAAFRDGEYMPDYEVYVQKYFGEIQGNRSEIEPSFMIVSNISNWIYPGSPYVMFLLYAIIGVSLKIVALRKISSLFFLSFVVYISNFYILLEMIQIRIGAASAFILLSLIPLYKRKFLQFALLVSIATFFHFSSLYAFVLWLLNPKEFSRKKFIFIIIVSYVFYFVGKLFLEGLFNQLASFQFLSRFEAYSSVTDDEDMAINPLGIYAITRLIVVLFFISFSKKLQNYSPYFPIFLKIYTIGVATYIGLALFPTISYRLGQLFMLVEIFLIPMMVYTVKRKGIGKLYVIGWSLLTFIMNVMFTTFFKYGV